MNEGYDKGKKTCMLLAGRNVARPQESHRMVNGNWDTPKTKKMQTVFTRLDSYKTKEANWWICLVSSPINMVNTLTNHKTKCAHVCFEINMLHRQEGFSKEKWISRNC